MSVLERALSPSKRTLLAMSSGCLILRIYPARHLDWVSSANWVGLTSSSWRERTNLSYRIVDCTVNSELEESVGVPALFAHINSCPRPMKFCKGID